MQRHIIDHAKDRTTARRLVEYVRQDRIPTTIDHRTARTRGDARLRQFLLIARGRTA